MEDEVVIKDPELEDESSDSDYKEGSDEEAEEYLRQHLSVTDQFLVDHPSVDPNKPLYRKFQRKEMIGPYEVVYVDGNQSIRIELQESATPLSEVAKINLIEQALGSEEDFQQLKELIYSDGVRSLKISAIIDDPEIKVYFRKKPIPNSEGEITQGFAIYDDKEILVNGPLDCLNDIVTLLHEVGHFKDSKYTTEEGRIKHGVAKFGILLGSEYQTADAWDGVHVLKNERNAWAFALKTLKPFMKPKNAPLTGMNVRGLIHGEALSTYSEGVKKAVYLETDEEN
ncbi:MAG: hypothetical protein Q7S79_01675 [bacterium]|nr:hypothetical protein [bacterium]